MTQPRYDTIRPGNAGLRLHEFALVIEGGFAAESGRHRSQMTEGPDSRTFGPRLGLPLRSGPPSLRAKDFAIREGAWKLIQPDGKPAELYDLASDPGEKRDLTAEKPEVAKRLAATLAGWRLELKPPAFPGSSVKNEDWGPGGANQKNKAPQKRAKKQP